MPWEGNKIIYKDLSYTVVGILFDVFNELGYGYKEKTYEIAIAKCLSDRNISFERQVRFDIKFKDEVIGINYLDFLIDKKIVLEIKKGNHFSRNNFEQVRRYLKTTGLKLAILANFTKNGVKSYRILNTYPETDL